MCLTAERSSGIAPWLKSATCESLSVILYLRVNVMLILCDGRVERYNTIAEDAESAVGAAADLNGAAVQTAGAKSPMFSPSKPSSAALSTISTMAAKQQSQVSLQSTAITGSGLAQADPSGSGLVSITTSPGSQLDMFQSPLVASPIAGPLAGEGSNMRHPPTDAMRDMHLWGQEPRYFPGVVTRSQRRNSTRQSSMHESDKA